MEKVRALWRRKHVLERLGFRAHASRSVWSHDLGQAIAFDDNLTESMQNPRRGHTSWHGYVSMLLAGYRTPRAIAGGNRSKREAEQGRQSLLPLVLDGHVEFDVAGEVWFCSDREIPLS